MNRRVVIGGGGGILFLVLLASLTLIPSGAGNLPTTKSAQGRGLLAVRTYLEQRGIPTLSWEQELTDLPEEPGLLVIANPISTIFTQEDFDALARWFDRKGNLLLLASGDEATLGEQFLLARLHLEYRNIRQDPPLLYKPWLLWRREEQTLLPADSPAGPDEGTRSSPGPRGRIGTFGVPQPGGARTLYVDSVGSPAIFEVPNGNGVIVVVNNVSLLANRLLPQAGNLDLLEQILSRTLPPGGSVIFDEWHQGHRMASAEARRALAGPLEMLAAHLLLLYLAAICVLSRPFGPRRRPPELHAGSMGRWLLSLASLHRRSGHAAQAGRLLLESAQQGARARGRTAALPDTFDGDEKELLELARQIGRWQQERKL